MRPLPLPLDHPTIFAVQRAHTYDAPRFSLKPAGASRPSSRKRIAQPLRLSWHPSHRVPDYSCTQAEAFENFSRRRITDQPFTFVLTWIPSPRPHPSDPQSLVFCYPGVKEVIIAKGVRPMPTNQTSGAFTIKDVPGAGKGLFAMADLPRGTRVLCERPLFVIPSVIPVITGEPLGPHGFPIRFANGILNAMDDEVSTQFVALYNCKGDARDVKGISWTRTTSTSARCTGSTHITPRSSTQCRGSIIGAHMIYLAESTVAGPWPTSSCSPNAYYTWEGSTFGDSLFTARPVSQSEELTIASPACQACRIPLEERKRSDARRGVLATVEAEGQKHAATFAAWVKNASLPDDYIVQRYLQYAQMMEEEALEAEALQWVVISYALAQASCVMKDAKNARMWTERLAQYTMDKTRTDGGRRELAKAPEVLEWWGMRVGCN
ncbi:hypothetical protein BV25DRAFT_1915454 [Artomyces pyxidatus]|uniref:Uncharacterized protein n=1 Tax=Artomyces pyxidatus TaxID=48021 RepID=A0ACB8T4S6_9AGAM|nr:hypothetical protein BV25DRAFT_1915454 [Artomyces pyxidatus]